MASKFQSRLIGTIILVAIGVIFLPDLFDGKKQHYQEQFASIPLQPEMSDEVEFETIPEPEFADVSLPDEPVTVVIDDGEAAVEVSQAKPEVRPAVKTEAPKVTEKVAAKVAEQPVKVAPVPETAPQVGNQDSGWVVQLGVFRNFDNAHSLVGRLREAGFQAHVFPKQPKKGDLARVVVGPDVSKEKLSGQLNELENLTGLKGRLLRFNPLNP